MGRIATRINGDGRLIALKEKVAKNCNNLTIDKSVNYVNLGVP